MSFPEFLSLHAQLINDYLEQFYTKQTCREDLETYLYSPLAQYNRNAGKRHRPLICMLASAAVGSQLTASIAMAAAIENFQTAAIIHDDIADDGQMRRGKPCLHITQGTGLAINDGDYALVASFDSIISDPSLDDSLKIKLLAELTSMMQRTIEGQALDLGWVATNRFDITVDDYLFMATHKTAFYSGAAPLACGALIGGGTYEQIETLRSFGMDTGLAFQIQDDLLNLVGKTEAREKDFRSDITEGKRTLVAVHALSHLDQNDHDELLGILEAKTTDTELLARAVELFNKAGSLEFARSYSLNLVNRAKEQLAPLNLEPGAKELLIQMADFFVERLR